MHVACKPAIACNARCFAGRGMAHRAGARSCRQRTQNHVVALLLALYCARCAMAALEVPDSLYECMNGGSGLQGTVYDQFVEGYPSR